MKKKWILAEIVFALVGLAACGDGEISKLTGEDESRYYLQDADYYASLMSSAMEACKNDPACAGKIGDRAGLEFCRFEQLVRGDVEFRKIQFIGKIVQ